MDFRWLWPDGIWIILIGAEVGVACALLGSFLILRRMSMLGDAISHAVLPGIVLAFLATHSLASLPMFVGAAAVGILAAFLIQTLSRCGVHGDAAIGVTFTALFAWGVLLITRHAQQVDLDLDCVLFGDLELAPLSTVRWAGTALGPRAVWSTGSLLAIDVTAVALFYKELKLCSFDPGLAAAVGLPVKLLHYALMGLVSVTVVGAFESVGAILVVAMLIVPGATAYLLTERLGPMLFTAAGIAVLSAVSGQFLAYRLDCSVAGAMGMMTGVWFALALLFAPRQGVLSRLIAQARLRTRVAVEDVLLWAARRAELAPGDRLPLAELAIERDWPVTRADRVVRRLARMGLALTGGGNWALTDEGARVAGGLLRRHRVYESFLGDLGYPPDHQHAPADRVEHHLSPELAGQIEEAAAYPVSDPQGKPIPAVPPDPRR